MKCCTLLICSVAVLQVFFSSAMEGNGKNGIDVNASVLSYPLGSGSNITNASVLPSSTCSEPNITNVNGLTSSACSEPNVTEELCIPLYGLEERLRALEEWVGIDASQQESCSDPHYLFNRGVVFAKDIKALEKGLHNTNLRVKKLAKGEEKRNLDSIIAFASQSLQKEGSAMEDLTPENMPSVLARYVVLCSHLEVQTEKQQKDLEKQRKDIEKLKKLVVMKKNKKPHKYKHKKKKKEKEKEEEEV